MKNPQDSSAAEALVSPGGGDLPNVILGGVPLLGKLTGIGHYTRQLAVAIQKNQLVGDFKLWGDIGFLHPNNADRYVIEPELMGQPTSQRDTIKSAMRHTAARSYFASRLYSWVTEHVAERRLAPMRSSHVYHSPNYILPRFSGSKVITIHDLSVIRFPEFHRAQMVKMCEQGIRRAINENTQIIVDSDLIGRELIEDFGVSEERVTAVHLAPDDRCRPRSESECTVAMDHWKLQYKSFFLSVGTIEPRKNLLRLFEAFRTGRRARLFDWPLVVVGSSGWKSDREHEALRALCRDGLALYLGYLTDADLHMLYSSAGALVFPSLYEGFGLPAADASASGCRVITSEKTAMAEIVDKDAALIDPHDWHSILEAMHKASSADGPLSKALWERSWSDVATETVAVYAAASA